MGHIDIEYEWFRLGAKEKTLISGKYVSEVDGGALVGECDDLEYRRQIIEKIG